jgi:uncharacterized membrane protein
MIRLPLLALLPLLLALAGCASGPGVYQPVANPIYSAIGHDPFWMLTIGDDRIVLRQRHGEGAAPDRYDETVFPRTPVEEDGNVRRWRSAAAARSIVIDVRQTPTPCENGSQSFEDFVRVTIGETQLDGCGGRPVAQHRS